MSQFNESQFNNILFNELNLDAPAPSVPSTDVYLSCTIYCDSNVSVNNSSDKYINPDIIIGTSSFYKNKFTKLIYLDANINTETYVTSNVRAKYNVSSTIETGTYIRAGRFLDININTESYVTAYVSGEFNLDSFINTETIISKAYLTGDFTLQSNIYTESTFNANARLFAGIKADITGETSITVEIDKYKRIQTDITTESQVTANVGRIIGLSARIESGSTFNPRIVYIASLTATVESFSNVLKLIDIEPNLIQGNTIVQATLRSSENFANSGRRRRVTFVFEVDKPRTGSNIIDEHYKIFNFYNSLANVSQTLNYVRRTATSELRSYNIDAETHRAWTGNSDLSTLRPGDRGVVQKNATGMFLGKDGYFAIYKGPYEPTETDAATEE